MDLFTIDSYEHRIWIRQQRGTLGTLETRLRSSMLLHSLHCAFEGFDVVVS
jgi:hypothetical protein